MFLMALLCSAAGLFYPLVNRYLLHPAVDATVNVTNYIDKMMGDGYAAAAGVTNIPVQEVQFSFWDPLLWLVLFVVVFVAAAVVIMAGKGSRGRVLEEGAVADPKYATFFSGEQELYSQVGGSDLFWGFKKNWKAYYRVMDKLHSGIVTDYTNMAVIAVGVFVIVMFIFLI